MKILFTGMGSSHCKRTDNTGFFAALADSYGEIAEVVWSPPKLSWTRAELEEFDAIFLGFMPPTSKSANYAYGALHVMNLMYESPKLNLVVDSPQMWQYKNSVNLFKRSPEQIFSSFYEKRFNFHEAKSGKARHSIESLSEKLNSIPWPSSIVPSLPWIDNASAKEKVSFVTPDSIRLINLDSFLLKNASPYLSRSTSWAVSNIKSTWWEKLRPTLRYDGIPLSDSPRRANDELACSRLKSSRAALLVPQERGTGSWWSYGYIQAMNTSTPVATHWQETLGFSPTWSLLPYNLEDMEPYDLQELASAQKKIYESAIPGRDEMRKALEKLVLESSKERL